MVTLDPGFAALENVAELLVEELCRVLVDVDHPELVLLQGEQGHAQLRVGERAARGFPIGIGLVVVRNFDLAPGNRSRDYP